MARGRFDRSTRKLIDQLTYTRDELASPAFEIVRDAMRTVGFDPDACGCDMQQAIDEAIQAESDQERAKNRYVVETAEDRVEAKKGAKWLRRLHGRLRVAMADEIPGSEHFPVLFRFGRLTQPRTTGVLYELRVVFPEAEALDMEALQPYGVTPAFLAEGRAILTALNRESKETAEAHSRQLVLTRRVRAAEKRIVQLIRRLEAMREVAAEETGQELPGFSLHILRGATAPSPAAPAEASDDADEQDLADAVFFGDEAQIAEAMARLAKRGDPDPT